MTLRNSAANLMVLELCIVLGVIGRPAPLDKAPDEAFAHLRRGGTSEVETASLSLEQPGMGAARLGIANFSKIE
jgi:hypothetical protein